MSTFDIIAICILIGLVGVLVDMYLITRRRWIRIEELRPYYQGAPGPGVDITGDLTTGAKYAIWKYMLSMLVVGGTVIGIITGVAGYMINDLAKEKAIQAAFSQMQKPLNDQ